MVRLLSPFSSHVQANGRFGVLEVAPLLNITSVRNFHLLHTSFYFGACLCEFSLVGGTIPLIRR